MERMTSLNRKVLSSINLFWDLIQKDYNLKQTDNADQEIHELIAKISDDQFDPLANNLSFILQSKNEFKASWAAPFKPEHTIQKSFDFGSGKSETIWMMRQINHFDYYEEKDDFKLVRIPYQSKNGRNFYKLIFLPNNAKRLSDLESRLSMEFIQDCLKKLQSQRVELMIPKLHIEKIYKLKKAFHEMQLLADVDFSKIVPGVYLKEIFHKTILKEDENGSSAASRTTALMGAISSKHNPFEPAPLPFHADHSFHQVIMEGEDLILFRGSVADSSAFPKKGNYAHPPSSSGDGK